MNFTYEEMYQVANEYMNMFGNSFNIYYGPNFMQYLVSDKLKREIEYKYYKFNDHYFYEDLMECDTYSEVIELIDYYLDNLLNMANLLGELPDNQVKYGEELMNKYLIDYATVLSNRREEMLGFIKNFNKNIISCNRGRSRA